MIINMKKLMIRVTAVLLCLLTSVSCLSIFTSAEKISYSKGNAGVSEAYKNSKYYKNLTSIELTGDGVTDTLAVALSQLEYVEGTGTSGFSGTQGGGGNFTEFCRNYGEGNAYAWCAAYVSFCLFQSRATTSTSKQTIWRDIYCPRWYQNMKNAGCGYAASSNYTPKSGDLVFFTGGGHIGIVRYCKDGKVYTIEGNTSNSAGLNPEGGGVYCKSYNRNYAKFLGFGSPPYKKNDKANKVDYTGEKPTTGLWISSGAKTIYTTTACSESAKNGEIPKGTVFQVTKIVTKTCYQVSYNGNSGYVKSSFASNTNPIYQVTNDGAAEKETTKATTSTTATVTPNKYAIDEAIKENANHIGSGITKYKVDGSAVKESASYTISAGQKFGIEGFAGFKSPINEFGYYIDGNAEGAVWGVLPKTATADVKSKAGDNAKLFDIEADTSTLTDGVHTVTFMVEFLDGETCELKTITLNVGEGFESGSETGESDGGCKSSVALGIALPIALIGGVVLIKKRED